MASIPGDSLNDGSRSGLRQVNWQYFLQDNLTGSWGMLVGVIVLTLLSFGLTYLRLLASPLFAGILFFLWIVGVGMVLAGQVGGFHTGASRWIHENLMSTISNALLTLFVVMLLGAAVYSFYVWGIANASFDLVNTAPEFREHTGATWGVIPAAQKLLASGRLDPIFHYRAWLSLGLVVLLALASAVVSFINRGREPGQAVGQTPLIVGWAASPFVVYVFLAGIPKGDAFISVSTLLTGTVALLALYGVLWWFKVVRYSTPIIAGWALAWPIFYLIWRTVGWMEWFPPINVDTWGGYLLTLIIAVSVILLSFPIGVFLALGRRSEVFGIPWWITWSVAILATIAALIFVTVPFIQESRNWAEFIIGFWPLLIPVAAYYFQNNFKGNVVSATCTLIIELVRGVPLITILFLAIVMAPFFFAEGTQVNKPFAVIIGYTLFSGAYMAETIRGGLQAIPKGQYEAADALGFNGLQKMRFIILPQALKIVIPAIVGGFIGTYKSSSLVAIVGLFDFLGITRSILANEEWLGLTRELYIFLALVYFVVSAIMSWYSRRLERQLDVGLR